MVLALPSAVRRAYGLARSLVMYYGVPGKAGRMRRLYRDFLGPGDLAFDVGAHVGNRVAVWRALGARVVAVEPQPDCLRLLALFYGRDPDVVLEPCALAAAAGRARLRIATTAPTCSSLDAGWVAAMERSPVFADVRWDAAVDVVVDTLDALVARHGEPAFCKIDVEGAELAVLAGLSRPLGALSFEYLPPAHDEALAVLARCEALGAHGGAGGYEYNYSPIETMRWASPRWLDAAGLARLLDDFRPRGRSGDVYARLRRAPPPRAAR